MKRGLCFLLIIVCLLSGVTTALSVTASGTSEADVTLSDPEQVRFFGRTYEKEGIYYFNWSASGFTFRFRGSGAVATLVADANGEVNIPYIKVYVDGEEMPDIALDKGEREVVLASGLDPREIHTVKVLKRTDVAHNGVGVKSLRLFDGETVSPTPASARLIEFIGDSITVGYATVAGDAGAWSSATEDVTKTYAEQIAAQCKADYTVTAISGKGIVRNYTGSSTGTMTDIYPLTDPYHNGSAAYDFAAQPDLVIINLGTNDASKNNTDLTSDAFEAGVEAFLMLVREKNPNARILYTYGFLGDTYAAEIQSAIENLRASGDTKIDYLALERCGINEMALGHPTADAYVKRGEAIAERAVSLMGWDEDETPPEKPKPSVPILPDGDIPVATVPRRELPRVAIAVGFSATVIVGAVIIVIIIRRNTFRYTDDYED